MYKKPEVADRKTNPKCSSKATANHQPTAMSVMPCGLLVYTDIYKTGEISSRMLQGILTDYIWKCNVNLNRKISLDLGCTGVKFC